MTGETTVAGTDLTFIEHRIPRGAGSIQVRDFAGSGPAFVMMHGFPDNSHIYDDLIPFLVAAGRRTIVFDFLGFGASDKPAGATYSFAQQLDDLRAVVEHLELGSIVPVAHDSSGIPALNFAIDHPANVASLVILNAAFANTAVGRWPELITLFATPGLKALSAALLHAPEHFAWIVNFQRGSFKAALVDKHRARYDSFLGHVIDDNFRVHGAGPAFAQMTAQFFSELDRNSGRLPLLKALDVPAKIIWGKNDPYINTGVAEEFAAYLSHSTLEVISAGHWLQIDEPELVAAAMLG